jgi:hypothetical protein
MSKCASVLVRRSIHPLTTNTRATAEARTKKCHFYKLLPKEFRRNGFCYRQVAREANAAIYEQTWNACQNPSVCWEVIRIRRRDGFQIDGRFVEPAEVYPTSEAWGTDGFTLTDRDAAFAKLNSMRAIPNAEACPRGCEAWKSKRGNTE